MSALEPLVSPKAGLPRALQECLIHIVLNHQHHHTHLSLRALSLLLLNARLHPPCALAPGGPAGLLRTNAELWLPSARLQFKDLGRPELLNLRPLALYLELWRHAAQRAMLAEDGGPREALPGHLLLLRYCSALLGADLGVRMALAEDARGRGAAGWGRVLKDSALWQTLLEVGRGEGGGRARVCAQSLLRARMHVPASGVRTQQRCHHRHCRVHTRAVLAPQGNPSVYTMWSGVSQNSHALLRSLVTTLLCAHRVRHWMSCKHATARVCVVCGCVRALLRGPLSSMLIRLSAWHPVKLPCACGTAQRHLSRPAALAAHARTPPAHTTACNVHPRWPCGPCQPWSRTGLHARQARRRQRRQRQAKERAMAGAARGACPAHPCAPQPPHRSRQPLRSAKGWAQGLGCCARTRACSSAARVCTPLVRFLVTLPLIQSHKRLCTSIRTHARAQSAARTATKQPRTPALPPGAGFGAGYDVAGAAGCAASASQGAGHGAAWGGPAAGWGGGPGGGAACASVSELGALARWTLRAWCDMHAAAEGPGQGAYNLHSDKGTNWFFMSKELKRMLSLHASQGDETGKHISAHLKDPEARVALLCALSPQARLHVMGLGFLDVVGGRAPRTHACTRNGGGGDEDEVRATRC